MIEGSAERSKSDGGIMGEERNVSGGSWGLVEVGMAKGGEVMGGRGYHWPRRRRIRGREAK